jgi:hypothetical protein
LGGDRYGDEQCGERRIDDAQQVLAQFAITARDETDVNVLATELARIVDETLQPERVKVGLRKPERLARPAFVEFKTAEQARRRPVTLFLTPSRR